MAALRQFQFQYTNIHVNREEMYELNGCLRFVFLLECLKSFVSIQNKVENVWNKCVNLQVKPTLSSYKDA